MLDPAHPPFGHDPSRQLILPVTQKGAEEVNGTVNAQSRGGRKADATPRAKRKKNHQDDDETRNRINKLGLDEQHIMKDYAGNTPESRMETLMRLEQHRLEYEAPPMISVGKLGPKKGKTQAEWICGICQERKNTFQKIAGHVTSHHWKLKVWSCMRSSCGRKYCSLNELTRHNKETHRRNRQASTNTDHTEPIPPPAPEPQSFSVNSTGFPVAVNYSEDPMDLTTPHPYSALSHPSNNPPSHATSTHPWKAYGPSETLQASLVQRHTRSSKPSETGPYPTRKPIIVRSPPTTVSGNGFSRHQRVAQTRSQNNPLPDHYISPSTHAYYAPSNAVDQGNYHRHAIGATYHSNATTVITHSPPHLIAAAGLNPSSTAYGGAHPMASISREGYGLLGSEHYQFDTPDSGHAGASSSQSQFQPLTGATHSTCASRSPRYRADRLHYDEGPASPGKASSSKDVEAFDAVPAQVDLDACRGVHQSHYLDSAYYNDPYYTAINQSSTGWNTAEVAARYEGEYFEVEKYMEQGNQADQVSRRSLYSWSCRLV